MAVTSLVLGSIAGRLRGLGFKKRAGAIFTLEVAEDVLGWLGLNTATRHLAPGQVEVNPVVGVRHQAIERIVAELRGEKFHAWIPPTVCTPMGYLMPGSRYQGWLLGDGDDESRVDDLVQAVAAYGLPFMRSGAPLPELRQLLDTGLGFDDVLVYRRPVAAALAGDVVGSLQAVDAAESGLGGRSDAAAAELRSFAAAFRERYGVSSSG